MGRGCWYTSRSSKLVDSFPTESQHSTRPRRWRWTWEGEKLGREVVWSTCFDGHFCQVVKVEGSSESFRKGVPLERFQYRLKVSMEGFLEKGPSGGWGSRWRAEWKVPSNRFQEQVWIKEFHESVFNWRFQVELPSSKLLGVVKICRFLSLRFDLILGWAYALDNAQDDFVWGGTPELLHSMRGRSQISSFVKLAGKCFTVSAVQIWSPTTILPLERTISPMRREIRKGLHLNMNCFCMVYAPIGIRAKAALPCPGSAHASPNSVIDSIAYGEAAWTCKCSLDPLMPILDLQLLKKSVLSVALSRFLCPWFGHWVFDFCNRSTRRIEASCDQYRSTHALRLPWVGNVGSAERVGNGIGHLHWWGNISLSLALDWQTFSKPSRRMIRPEECPWECFEHNEAKGGKILIPSNICIKHSALVQTTYPHASGQYWHRPIEAGISHIKTRYRYSLGQNPRYFCWGYYHRIVVTYKGFWCSPGYGRGFDPQPSIKDLHCWAVV